MKAKLAEIARNINGSLIGEDREIKSVCIDSRQIKSGDLYVAIKGERFDGHDFIEQAVRDGVVAVVTEQPLEIAIPQLRVNDTRIALADIAGYWRRQSPVKIAGVTGSNGKTTVKEMIASILAVNEPVLSTQGNFNNDIGVPLTLLGLQPQHQFAVVEMGANHIGEIAFTSSRVKPDVAVINNVGPAHLEGFGSLEGIARAKGELIENLAENGVAVLNREDAFFDFWTKLADGHEVVSFGIHQQADVRADNIRVTVAEEGFVTGFDLLTPSGNVAITLNLAGVHNVKNALAAAAVSLAMGADLQQIRQGLAGMKAVNGRLQTKKGSRGEWLIDDTYNANPASLKAGLEVLKLSEKEPWVVLGAFGEMGQDSQQIHTEIGRLIKSMNIVRLLAVGSDARYAVEAFGSGATFFNTQDDLIKRLQQQLSGTEAILVKGSRSQKMERVVQALTETGGN